MRKIKIRIPAKINLTLDVVGNEKGYHNINSLVTSIDVYDEITVKERKDDSITLVETGIKSGCMLPDNNAFKAAKLFKEHYSTQGVDIILNKKIPVGGGLGGSSADIAGVLKAMNELFCLNVDVKPFANSLGSDSGYMTDGGLAVLHGRGDIVEKIDGKLKLYLIIITEEKMVSAKTGYAQFDKQGRKYIPATEDAVNEIKGGGELKEILAKLKNDLYPSAIEILPAIAENKKLLENAGALKAVMTGSGSAVYGVFENVAKRNAAFKELEKIIPNKIIKAQTL